MKIVHCPRNEDPLDYARRYSKRGGGLGDLLHGNVAVLLLLVAFVVMTFTVGPLKKKPTETPPPPPTSTPVAVVLQEPTLCKLPGGGMIEAGWSSFVTDGVSVVRVRCMDDGTLTLQEEATD